MKFKIKERKVKKQLFLNTSKDVIHLGTYVAKMKGLIFSLSLVCDSKKKIELVT